ncbi:hypothetical protein L1987_09486 [Smallanthus sonchifolius]|uniref:Uncharacterized protein n=1 Tax=Smallanthus sonchifolius TaxID=185202 RepID=A0ACB9JNK2_9ASTR|nr:hypothetical protein L1987_09486 [Smallanthus sonchifolius]
MAHQDFRAGDCFMSHKGIYSEQSGLRIWYGSLSGADLAALMPAAFHILACVVGGLGNWSGSQASLRGPTLLPGSSCSEYLKMLMTLCFLVASDNSSSSSSLRDFLLSCLRLRGLSRSSSLSPSSLLRVGLELRTKTTHFNELRGSPIEDASSEASME